MLICDALNAIPSRFGLAPYFVTFKGFASQTDTNSTGIISYNFNFGDGSTFNPTGGGNAADHTYQKPGTYKVVLTVTDSTGQTVTSPACQSDIVVSAASGGTPPPGQNIVVTTTPVPTITVQPSAGVNMYLVAGLFIALLSGIILKHVSSKSIR